MYGIKNINVFDVYSALTILYYLQGILYQSGSINKIIQLILIVWGGICMLKTLEKGKMPLILKSATTLIAIYSLYGLISLLSYESYEVSCFGSYTPLPKYYVLQTALNSLLPLYVLFLYIREGKVTELRLKTYAMVFLVLFILCYYHLLETLLQALHEKGLDRTETTNNMGYRFITLIPFILFFRNQVTRFILLGVVMSFVFFCMKRGAIMIGSILSLWLIWETIHNSNKTAKILTILTSVILLIGAVYFVFDLYDSSPYFRRRVEATLDGDTSGRDVLVQSIVTSLKYDPSYLHLFFGRGSFGTIEVAGNFAHNDWIELACDFGLLGVGLGLFFYISIFAAIRRLRGYISHENSTILMMSFVSLVLPTFFSMSLTNMAIWNILPMFYIMFNQNTELALQSDETDTMCY